MHVRSGEKARRRGRAISQPKPSRDLEADGQISRPTVKDSCDPGRCCKQRGTTTWDRWCDYLSGSYL